MALLYWQNSHQGLKRLANTVLAHPWVTTLATRLAMATLDGRCQQCKKAPAAWLCETCRDNWVDPLLVHYWPTLDCRVYSLHPLSGRPKSQLYGAKFYQGTPWWCTALLAEGLRTLMTPETIPSQFITLITLPGRHRQHWMQRVADCLALDLGITHQTLNWTRDTLPQHTRPTPEARWLNLENALKLDTLPPAGAIILLDDVTTTGASLFHAAQALRQAGYTQPLVALTLCYVPKA